MRSENSHLITKIVRDEFSKSLCKATNSQYKGLSSWKIS
jgi:hypothetical protein